MQTATIGAGTPGPSNRAGTPAPSKLGAVLRVISGNFLEQFDFFLFGFYATYIAKAFFPAASEFASLIDKRLRKALHNYLQLMFRVRSASEAAAMPKSI